MNKLLTVLSMICILCPVVVFAQGKAIHVYTSTDKGIAVFNLDFKKGKPELKFNKIVAEYKDPNPHGLDVTKDSSKLVFIKDNVLTIIDNPLLEEPQKKIIKIRLKYSTYKNVVIARYKDGEEYAFLVEKINEEEGKRCKCICRVALRYPYAQKYIKLPGDGLMSSNLLWDNNLESLYVSSGDNAYYVITGKDCYFTVWHTEKYYLAKYMLQVGNNLYFSSDDGKKVGKEGRVGMLCVINDEDPDKSYTVKSPKEDDFTYYMAMTPTKINDVTKEMIYSTGLFKLQIFDLSDRNKPVYKGSLKLDDMANESVLKSVPGHDGYLLFYASTDYGALAILDVNKKEVIIKQKGPSDIEVLSGDEFGSYMAVDGIEEGKAQDDNTHML